MITYTRTQTENEAEIVIEKVNTDHHHSFTKAQVVNQWADLDKMHKEQTAQRRVEDAKLENIRQHHPFVSDLTEEQLVAAKLYSDALRNAKICKENIERIEEAQKELKEEVEAVKGQTGLDLLSVEEAQ